MREPCGLELVDGDRRLRAAALVPDAEPHLRVLVDVTRHAQHLSGVSWVRAEELDVLSPQRRGAPRTEAETLLDLAPALSAGVHALSLH